MSDWDYNLCHWLSWVSGFGTWTGTTLSAPLGLQLANYRYRSLLNHQNHMSQFLKWISVYLYTCRYRQTDLVTHIYLYLSMQYIHVSCVSFSATSWTIACQAPLSMELSRQQYWSGLPFPTPGDLLNPGIEPVFPASPAFAGGFFTTNATWEAQCLCNALLVLFVCRTQTNRFQISSSFSREIKKVLKQPYFQSMQFFFLYEFLSQATNNIEQLRCGWFILF